MITPSFDFATRLVELAFDLDNDKEQLPAEHQAQAYALVLNMYALAERLYPAVFYGEMPEEPAESFSPHVMIVGDEP